MRDGLLTLPCGYLAFSDTNVICGVNTEGNRLLGYTGTELIGQPLRLLLSPGTRMLLQAHLYPLLARDARADELYLGLRGRDGVDVPCLVNAARRAQDGEFINELVFIPMRRRQYFEREYVGARQGARLAQQAERAALDKVEQIESKIAGSERLIALGILAAGIAHEVNNPLTYVFWGIEHLRELIGSAVKKSHGERVSQALDDVELGASHIRGVVSGLKLFSRVEDERRVRLEVGKILQTAKRMVQFEVKPRARLDVTCETPSPVITGDEGKLTQVLVNLILNASQAFAMAGLDNVITVRARTAPSDATVLIDVQDNGPGIPSEIQEQIFEPFFTTKPVGVGTGLGLSICHGIVTSLGGTLSVSSRPGHGATFTIALPMASETP